MPRATRATSSPAATASRTFGVARVGPPRLGGAGDAEGPVPGMSGASLGRIGELAAVEDQDREREAKAHGREVGDHLEPRDRASAEEPPEVEIRTDEAADLFTRAGEPGSLEQPRRYLERPTYEPGHQDRDEVADAGQQGREQQQ